MGRCWVSREVGASGSNHCIMLGPIPGGKKMRFCIYYSQVALVVKNPPTNAGDIRDKGFDPWRWEDVLAEEMATHCSIPAWRIPWTEEPGGLASVGSQRVGHN